MMPAGMTESETVEWALSIVLMSNLKDEDTLLIKVGALRQLQKTIAMLRAQATEASWEAERRRQEQDERFDRDWV